ncbi:MAG: hypothetical protein IJF84_13165 [Thermoguttaceae bacterium]|nr:hypothetical protein [Thermoguttaceae bacterium]
MGIDNIQHLKKGDRLKASTVNAIVDHLKNNPTPTTKTGGIQNIRQQTLFYTKVDIPAYSIFPLISNADSTENTFYSKYTVEQYNAANACLYIPGYFGTNGRFPIPANSQFYGTLLNRDFDSPIKVCDYEKGKTQCGFMNESWEASVHSYGLILNGKAPHSQGCCYARLARTGDMFLLELQDDIPECVVTHDNICVTCGKAWVLTRKFNNGLLASCSCYVESDNGSSCDALERVRELGEYVYNRHKKKYKAKDADGNIIPYLGIRDNYGTIWLENFWGGDEHKVKFVRCNAGYTDHDNVREFVDYYQEADPTAYEEDNKIEATIAPYLQIEAIQTGGVYRAEFISDYERWFITDGICTDYVSPWAPVRIQHVSGVGGTTVLSGNFTDTGVLYSTDDTIIEGYYDASLSSISAENAFEREPKFGLTKLPNSTQAIITFSDMVLKTNAEGYVCFVVWARDPVSCSNSAYRLLFYVHAHNIVPTFTWSNDLKRPEDPTVWDTTRIFECNSEFSGTKCIGTVDDANDSELKVDVVTILGNADNLKQYSFTIDSEKKVYLNYEVTQNKPCGATIVFKVDDGHQYKAESGEYVEYHLTIHGKESNTAPEVRWHGSNITDGGLTKTIMCQQHSSARVQLGEIYDPDDGDSISVADLAYNQTWDGSSGNGTFTIEITRDKGVFANYNMSSDSTGTLYAHFKVDDGYMNDTDFSSYGNYKTYTVALQVKADTETSNLMLSVSETEIRLKVGDSFAKTIANVSFTGGGTHTYDLVLIDRESLSYGCIENMKLTQNGNQISAHGTAVAVGEEIIKYVVTDENGKTKTAQLKIIVTEE